MRRTPGRQSGAVLLAILLVFISLASAYLLSRLGDVRNQTQGQRITAAALARAKAALIGYAARYPDNPAFVDPLAGPGFLPCPDTDGNGTPNPPCNAGAVMVIGRLPWRELGLDDIRDGNDEPLWYAVSSNYRNNPKIFPLNSETAGQFTIDTVTPDVVAVILSPGESLGAAPGFAAQARPSNDPDDYLEGDNNDYDVDFVSRAAAPFNDRLMPITRRELMAVVERRVMGEVVQALHAYRNDYGAFPWLAPFSDPRDPTVYEGVVGTGEGLLPVHLDGDEFATNFTVDWNITNANVVVGGVIQTSDLEIGTLSITSGGKCRWMEGAGQGRARVACTGTGTDPGPPSMTYLFDMGFSDTNALFNGAFQSATGPDAGQRRTRSVQINGGLPEQLSGGGAPAPMILVSSPQPVPSGSIGTLTIDADTTGVVTVTGINYDINLNEGQEELPHWFTHNAWHHLIYVALSPGNVPGAGGCVVGTDCLAVNNLQPGDDKQALVVIAGPQIPGLQDRAASPDILDYLEGENATLNGIYQRGAFTPDLANFNDQLRIVAP